jgi:hypothetical protein
MIQTVTAQDIQKLEIFETFDRRDRLMALKPFNVQVVNQGIIIYRTSKEVDPRIIGRNYRVLKELIEKEEEKIT